jgi:hypothetical protein
MKIKIKIPKIEKGVKASGTCHILLKLFLVGEKNVC